MSVSDSRPVIIERHATPRGELALRRCGNHFEIISNGVFLMDTRGGVSEGVLVRASLEDQQGPAHLLLAGLGVGFSLIEALRCPAVERVTVVEREPAVLGWHQTHLAAFSQGALRDPRVTVVCTDFLDWLQRGRNRFEAICVDVDNGPDWTVTPRNAVLYRDPGLAALHRRLAAGGTLAVWSAAASADFEARLRRRFERVDVRSIAVRRGEPDRIYLARTPARRITGGRRPQHGQW